MGKIFGTDGARGLANGFLTPELALNIGRAAAIVLTAHLKHSAKIIIGKDTRISSDMLEAALMAGICSVGADAVSLGVVPTPAVAFLVKDMGADAGVMISASHNSFEDNGIKLFGGEGCKLPDRIEDEIEKLIFDDNFSENAKKGAQIGRMYEDKEAVLRYITYVSSTATHKLDGIKALIDCANGSAYTTAKALFCGLGADVTLINVNPDGININDNCGSTKLTSLQEHIKKGEYDIGIAFDGDADRCLCLDHEGNTVDGDQIMAILASGMKSSGTLIKNTLVVTVMSNLGLFHAMEREGIITIKTQVGDRYVLEEMLSNGYRIGGEQSGHVILLDYMTTGDGQLCAVKLMEIMAENKKSLKELSGIMKRYPQVLKGVKVEDKSCIESDNVKAALDRADEMLGGDGRVLLRPSGTEPVVRVMVEGSDEALINKIADMIVGEIKNNLK